MTLRKKLFKASSLLLFCGGDLFLLSIKVEVLFPDNPLVFEIPKASFSFPKCQRENPSPERNS